MAIAFFPPKTIFTVKTQLRTSSVVPIVQCENHRHRAVAVFSHHRDVKVALEELDDSGFSRDSLTLVARQAKRCIGCSELITNSNFDDCRFSLNLEVQKFFSRLFKKGKYLLLVNGSEHDVDAACKIISRRRNHAEVWHFEQMINEC